LYVISYSFDFCKSKIYFLGDLPYFWDGKNAISDFVGAFLPKWYKDVKNVIELRHNGGRSPCSIHT
jgi:hypothetical protein